MKKSLLLAAALTLTCFSVTTFSYSGEDSDSVVSSSELKRSADIDARLFLLKGKYKKKLSVIDGGYISDTEGKIIATMQILIESKMDDVEATLNSFVTQEDLVHLNYNKLSRDLKEISVLIDEL
jgi:hypothetical protein